MRQVLNSFLYAVKAKFTKLWTLIKLYTNPTFIKNRVLLKIKSFFTKLLDIKPRDKDDYYTIFRWMISKKLAFAIVVFLGIVSVLYIFIMKPVNINDKSETNSIPTYKYNSIPLKYYSGQAKILAKSGYVAYVGNVKDGTVKGQGKLYSKNGNLVYEGQFDNNKYNGDGRRYYPDNILWYEGQFKDNNFFGTGMLYRDNGVLEYSGEFSENMKNGKGELYDSTAKLVFTGTFKDDYIQYSQLLGKTTTDAGNMYTGNKVVYSGMGEFGMIMEDIDAAYYGISGDDTLDESYTVGGVFVLKNNVTIGSQLIENIPTAKKIFGDPKYQGNTNVKLIEAACINKLADKGLTKFDRIEIKSNSTFSDVIEATSLGKTQEIYIYTFENNGLNYTFYSKDKNSTFDFYLIEKAK